ncbi:HNH family endonuclease (plasmid) [Halalkaliarchaeum sp. AArc-CO]|nr:HNH family endonuclease [Halalkaliarchaeum sp. AArc-CO]
MAVKAAGFVPREPTCKIPIEELLEELRSLAEELDRKPWIVDMRDHGEYSATTYYNRFELRGDAIEAAKLSELE